MKFLAQSDARVERLRGERVAVLDQGWYLLNTALELPIERSPLLEDEFVDIEAELTRRLEEAQAPTTAHVPQRGNPVAQDFDGMTDAELERELRELAITAGFTPEDSPMRVIAANRMRVIEFELARRAEERDQ